MLGYLFLYGNALWKRTELKKAKGVSNGLLRSRERPLLTLFFPLFSPLGVGHISNAGAGRINPGSEYIRLGFQFPISAR